MNYHAILPAFWITAVVIWFYVTYPDAVVVRITEGKVVNFAYYH